MFTNIFKSKNNIPLAVIVKNNEENKNFLSILKKKVNNILKEEEEEEKSKQSIINNELFILLNDGNYTYNLRIDLYSVTINLKSQYFINIDSHKYLKKYNKNLKSCVIIKIKEKFNKKPKKIYISISRIFLPNLQNCYEYIYLIEFKI